MHTNIWFPSQIKDALEDVSKERTLLQERCSMLEAQLVTMKENITLSMNERVNKVIRELSEERSRSQEILRELRESRDKMRDLQADHQKIISDLKKALFHSYSYKLSYLIYVFIYLIKRFLERTTRKLLCWNKKSKNSTLPRMICRLGWLLQTPSWPLSIKP